MKKYFLLLIIIFLAVIFGQFAGSVYSGIPVSQAMGWSLGWTSYLWPIHVPIVLIYSFLSIGIYAILNKIFNKSESKKYFLLAVVFNIIVPFSFYFWAMSQGVTGRF